MGRSSREGCPWEDSFQPGAEAGPSSARVQAVASIQFQFQFQLASRLLPLAPGWRLRYCILVNLLFMSLCSCMD